MKFGPNLVNITRLTQGEVWSDSWIQTTRSHLDFRGVLLAGVASANEVEGLRLWSGPESTRVVLDLSAPTPHRIFNLDNPFRVVIDLTDASYVNGLPEGRGVVVGVRTGAQQSGQLRVVLDVSQRVNPQSFLLEPNGTYGHRLVIDLTPYGRGSRH